MQAASRQRIVDRLLEGRFENRHSTSAIAAPCLHALHLRGKRGWAFLRILQVVTKSLRAWTRQLLWQIGGVYRADDDHLMARACDGDVEAALAAAVVDWAEVRGYFAGGVFAVANAQDDHVAL